MAHTSGKRQISEEYPERIESRKQRWRRKGSRVEREKTGGRKEGSEERKVERGDIGKEGERDREKIDR